jgi:CheY-like chemotaxis protein
MSPAAPLDVLVAEDTAEFRESVAAAFRARGDRVRTAENGLEALGLCVVQPPDLLLSDVEMPQLDGWNLLRIVRSRSGLEKIPFIFLTALSGEEERLRGYEMGVDDYIAKPFDPADILARADHVLERERRAPGQRAAKSLRGDLERVSLPSLLSFFEMERMSGVLVVRGSETARLHLREGQPVRLDGGGAGAPRDRLFEILGWERGEFDLYPGEPASGDDFGERAANLLILWAHQRDEALR